jgi:hypothetical protein
MRNLQVLVLVCALLVAASASAVETWHIGGVAGGTIYVKWDADVFSSGNWDDPALNSPLHESWNLVDEYVGGVLNPYYLGAGSTYPDGFYGKVIMYDQGELRIDAGAKVGVGYCIWSGGNVSGGGDWGKVIVEDGWLITERLRHWKGGGTSWHSVLGDGILEANYWEIGSVDVGDNIVHGLIADNALAKVENLLFQTAGSTLDITGGELLVANYSPSEVQGLIGDGWITNTTGEGLFVTTKGAYTSVTLVPEPATLALLGIGLAWLRRKS